MKKNLSALLLVTGLFIASSSFAFAGDDKNCTKTEKKCEKSEKTDCNKSTEKSSDKSTENTSDSVKK